MAREGAALVTGATRGIGAAIATTLASEGWPVGVNFRSDAAGAERVIAAIEQRGGQALAVQGDVSDPDAADRLCAQVEERFGPVMVLVNNAGVRADNLSPQIDDEDWRLVLDTNLSGPFRLIRRALRPMMRARFGSPPAARKRGTMVSAAPSSAETMSAPPRSTGSPSGIGWPDVIRAARS